MIHEYFYLLVFFPLMAATLSLSLRGRKKITFRITLFMSFVQFALSLVILLSGHYGAESVAGNWPAGIGIKLKVDLFSLLMLTVVNAVYFAGALYFIKGKTAEKSKNFDFLYNSLFLGLSGAFLTHDLFNLFVWFEVTLMSSYVLVVLNQDLSRLKAGLKYIVLNFLSGMIFLLSVGLIYGTTKTLDFQELQLRLSELYLTDPAQVRLLGLSLFTAFAIKSAFFPLFFWLPESYPKLSPGLSGVFAGLLTKLGLYAMIRLFGQVFPADNLFHLIVLILSVLTLLIGVWGAVIQTHIRKILSYHVISQVGFIAVGVSFCLHPNIEVRQFAITASIFYIVHHVIVKTNLFFVSGIIRSNRGSEELPELGGLFRSSPFLALLFIIPAASLIGIPPFSGFWAKLGMFKLAIETRELWVVLSMIVGSFFTLYSMVKIWDAAYWGEVKGPKENIEPIKNLRPYIASLFLGLLTVAISVAPFWLQNLALEVGKRGLE